MRILVCNWKDLAHPRAGGAEVWTHGVAEAWVEAGHDVVLATSTAPALAARDERNGVTILRGGDYRFGVHRHAREVYRQFSGNFDVVIDEINTRPFNAPQWAHGSQVVAYIHQVAREVWFHETPLPVAVLGRYVLEPRWLRAYRGVPLWAPSPSTADSLRAYGAREIVAVPQAAPLPETAGAPAEKAARPTFVFVGRLCSMKRPLDAIAAFRLVKRRAPNAELRIIGTGPLEEKVGRLAGAGVSVLGALSAEERDREVARAHALIATSVREGWGLVVSEAAALGTGSIGYAVPGLVDSIGASGGVTVAPTPQSLARAMTHVALDPSSAPRPISTGTVPFAAVARTLLDYRKVLHDA